MNYTDAQLLDRVRSLPSFKGFPAAGTVLDIWVRSKADTYDRFDDKAYTYLCFGEEKPPEFKMVSTGTTNAGSFGLKNFRTYNPQGCAVLKSDVIVYDSHRYGLHKGKPAYRQARGFPYYRDGNMNNRCEEIGEEYSDIILANCHAASTFSTIISNWSVACLVRNQRAQFDSWLNFMNKHPLSVAILKEF
jgi:hypothetical protein